MEVEFHPLVRGQVLEAARMYYDVSPRLAEEFDVELKATIANAAGNPLRFHPTGEGFRRANVSQLESCIAVFEQMNPLDRQKPDVVNQTLRDPALRHLRGQFPPDSKPIEFEGFENQPN